MIRLIIYSLFVTSLFLSSCTNDIDLQADNPKIKAELERKKIEFINEIRANCKIEAVKRAELYVDSMVAADFFMELSGTIPFPEKPIKPAFDGPIVIKDTIKARPILK